MHANHTHVIDNSRHIYTNLIAVGCVGTSYTVSATLLKAVTALPLLTVTAADITGQLATVVTLLQCMYILSADIIAVVPVAGNITVILVLPNVLISVAVVASLHPPVLTSIVLRLTTIVKPNVGQHCVHVCCMHK